MVQSREEDGHEGTDINVKYRTEIFLEKNRDERASVITNKAILVWHGILSQAA